MMGADTDFAGLCSRVDELEATTVMLVASNRALTSQIAEIAVEQAEARKYRERQERRFDAIDERIDELARAMTTLTDAQGSVLQRLDGIGARVDAAAAVTDSIAVAIRWIDRLRKALIWIGAPILAIGSIWAGIQMMRNGGPPPPPPPSAGGPF